MRRVGIIGALVLLAACSGASKAGSLASTPTTLATATVRQVASVVAQNRSSLQVDLAHEQSCPEAILDIVNEQAFDNNHGTPGIETIAPLAICRDVASKATADATALDAGLHALIAPAELRSLVQQTRSAAAAVTTIGDSLSTCLGGTTVDELVKCVQVDTFTQDEQSLTSTLAGWDPYSG